MRPGEVKDTYNGLSAGGMIPTLRGVRYRRLHGWGHGLLWGSLCLVGLLGVAYIALGFAVVVSCGLPPVTQVGSALSPALGQAMPALLAPIQSPAASWPLIIGHSGSTYWCRPNTLGCLARSLALGATMLEVDIRLSADGYLVAFHDADVDHQTDGTGAVQSLTREQLQALHIKRAVTPSAVEADEPPTAAPADRLAGRGPPGIPHDPTLARCQSA